MSAKGRHRQHLRRGQATVELALVSFVVFTLLLGVLDLGRLMLISAEVQNAANEGARAAIVPTNSDGAITAAVTSRLQLASGATISISPSGSRVRQQPVTVQVDYTFRPIVGMVVTAFGTSFNVRGRARMTVE